MADVAIIGGGLAGSAAACHLAKAGRSVVLFERETTPHHKVCGEFVSAEAQTHLRYLGVNLFALGALPIRRLRLVHGNRCAELRLPFPAASLSRFVLDEHLLNRARDLGAEIRRGTSVRMIERQAPGHWQVASNPDGVTTARTVFLATGKHDMRPFRRVHRRTEDWIGFKLYFRLSGGDTRTVHDVVEVALFDGGYAGLLWVGDATLNLCLLIRKTAFVRLSKSWPALLAALMESSPHLAHRLAKAVPCWDEPLAVASLPFGYLCDDHGMPDGLYRLGDQACVIPSFSGSGISIALHSARLASEFLLRGEDAATYHRELRRDLAIPLRLASCLTTLAARDWTRDLTVQACRAFPAAFSLAAMKTRIRPRPLATGLHQSVGAQ